MLTPETFAEYWAWFSAAFVPLFLALLRVLGPWMVSKVPALDKPLRFALRVGPDLVGGVRVASGQWDPEKLARVSYEAYSLSSGGLLSWDDLPSEQRRHWVASVAGIMTLAPTPRPAAPPPPPTPPGALLALCLALSLLPGLACQRPIDQAVVTVNASHAFLASANATLADLHRRARDKAVERAGSPPEALVAVADVHERYRPAWDAYDVARTSWLVAEASTRAALALEASGGEPDVLRVMGHVARLSAAFVALERAAEALPLLGAGSRP